MYYLVCISLGYILGCLQASYIVGKLIKKVDIRDYGSKNPGATNAMRVFGTRLGLFCMLIDILKALSAVLIARYILDAGIILLLITGLGVILGHNYPFYMNFKGGKGIAATLGVFLAIDYRAFLLAGIPALVVLFTTKYMSAASLVYSFLLIISMAVFYHNQPLSYVIILLTAVYTALSFWRHRENIVRLYNGTERRLGEK
jgi:glycerol-3-phosphate acyltransferase PlsY